MQHSTGHGNTLTNRKTAAHWADQLLRSFHNAGGADPEVFVAGVVAMFCDYPENVVSVVCNPARGLPSRLKFLPTLAEIKEALEAEMEPIRRELERRRRIEQTRALLPHHRRELSPEERARAVQPALQFVAEAKARAAQIDRRSWLSPEELRAQAGLTPEQWAAIPDAPKGAWRNVEAA